MADRSVSIALEARVSGFVNGVKTAQRAVTGFQAELDKSARKRAALDNIGASAGKMGLAAAAGLGMAIAAAANFDAAMSGVEAATGEGAAGMEQLRQAALKAGAETAFSATEAAEGIEQLAKAGVSTQDILAGGLSGALDLAAAGQISVGEAAETAARAMTQFGLSGEQVPHVADLLAAAAGKASGEVSDFGQALNQSGLVADQVGVSIEETTGALAAFASAGLQGSDAGTSFKTMLGSLTPNSAKAKGLMDELGISAYDAQGNFIGLAEFAGQLQNALGDMSAEQRQAALETIFGSDAVRAASVLYEQGESGIRQWTSAVDDQGFAAEQAATKLDNLKGDLEALGGALETALIKTGDGSQGPLRSTVQAVTDLVNAYANLPSGAQDATAAILGVTALLGGGAWAASKTVQGISNTRNALADLGVQAGTTRTALSAVGKGIAVAAALEGLNLLDKALDDLLDSDFEGSDLQRSLEALAQGNVAGTLSDVWGGDLKGLNHDLDTLDNSLERVVAFPDKILPGSWSQLEGARDRFRDIDAALASLVESGRGDEAAAIFALLAAKAEEGGNSVTQLSGMLEQYGIAVRNSGKGASWLGNAIGGLIPKLEAETSAAQDNAAAHRQDAKALSEARAQRIRNQNAVINWEASIDDATKSARENGRTLDVTTEKGRANRTALLQMAAAWNDQSGAVRRNKGEQQDAIGTFVRVARQMGMNADQARAYAQRLLDIPPRRETRIDLEGVSAAISSANALESRLNSIDDEHVYVYTHHVNARGGTTSEYGGRSAEPKATGGAVHAGQVYRVGELGTETFVPATSGHIMSAHATRQAASPELHATLSLSDRDVNRIATAVRDGAFEGTAKAGDERTRTLHATRRV